MPPDISTKETDSEVNRRKGLIDPYQFAFFVQQWQKERPLLPQKISNLGLLTFLALEELEEVDEHKQVEGMLSDDTRYEVEEIVDFSFFLAAITSVAGNNTDFYRVMQRANGQASGSNALDIIGEVVGNISEKSLKKDLEYAWVLLISYLINMKFSVDLIQVLEMHIIPKNNGNLPKKFLQDNYLFRLAHNGRKMNPDEEDAHSEHLKKAMRIIRKFTKDNIDPEVEHNGLSSEHYEKYEMFIYNFMYFSGTGMGSEKALQQLKDQLHIDYNIPKPVDKILIAKV